MAINNTDDRAAAPSAGGGKIDPERGAGKNPFDSASGYSGQEHTPEREQALGRANPSGHPLNGDPMVGERGAVDASDTPPDAGRRASFDPKTGEVHGSGSGAGGGHEGEDYDIGTPGGA